MEERYSRNRIYVRSEEQQFIRNYRILSGGAGIGGIIAECALRFGFDEWCQWIENKSRCVSFGTVPAFNLIAIYCS